MTERPARLVPIGALRELKERLLVAAGCDEEVAKAVADVFLEANLRGIPTQGLHHLVNVMLPLLTLGRIDPGAKPRIAKERAGAALVDGGRGPGQLAAILAADLAAQKAMEAGSAVACVVNGADIFMLGYYVERIARRGLVGLGFTNSAPLVHPTGGRERMLGTNPLAIAMPRGAGHPLLLDVATSVLSAGHVRHAMYHGEPLPPGAGLGPDGHPTPDAETTWKRGALGPLGGHKGYGLGLMVALLSGALAGGALGAALHGWLPEHPEAPAGMGHTFMAIDPGSFAQPSAFTERVETYVQTIKGSKKAPGAEAIRVPGERAFAERERNLANGTVPVFEAIWEQTARRAAELGVSMPG